MALTSPEIGRQPPTQDLSSSSVPSADRHRVLRPRTSLLHPGTTQGRAECPATSIQSDTLLAKHRPERYYRPPSRTIRILTWLFRIQFVVILLRESNWDGV